MSLKFAVTTAPVDALRAAPLQEGTPFSVSAKAAKRIGEILKSEPIGSSLRVSVEGGGCSGFQYKFEIASTQDAEDTIITRDGISVLVDAVSAPFLAGSELDFVTELMGQSFQIKNPNATASCGCGTSFSM